MESLKLAYRILSQLEKHGNAENVGQYISPDALKVDDKDWLRVIKMLLSAGYIEGVTVKEDVLGGVNVNVSKAMLTMRGAEYLAENGIMTKIGKAVSNIISRAK